jgi:hypothetical protein
VQNAVHEPKDTHDPNVIAENLHRARGDDLRCSRRRGHYVAAAFAESRGFIEGVSAGLAEHWISPSENLARPC